jgi:DNA-directed RNA polymerase subunit E'/Rpb7
MAQIEVYYKTQLETSVSLLPDQIDYYIDNHLLQNLKQKMEGKTSEHGIVMKISKIIKYDNGLVDKINLMGTTVFHVTYECLICSPIKNLEIICRIDNIIKGYLVGINGPMIVTIQYNNINTHKFEIKNSEIIEMTTGKKLKQGQYVKATIINTDMSLGERNIIIFAKLNDLANEKEIELYHSQQKLFHVEPEEIHTSEIFI